MKLPLNNYAISSGYDTEAVEVTCARCSFRVPGHHMACLIGQVVDAGDVTVVIEVHEDLFHREEER